jgi:hypothetical protein
MKMKDFQKHLAYAHKKVFGKEIEFDNENDPGLVPVDFDEYCEVNGTDTAGYGLMFAFKDGKMTLSSLAVIPETRWEQADMDVVDLETFSDLGMAVKATMLLCFGRLMEIIEENLMVDQLAEENALAEEYMKSLKYAKAE